MSVNECIEKLLFIIICSLFGNFVSNQLYYSMLCS